MRRYALAAALTALALACVPRTARAGSEAADEARLRGRLAPETAAQVLAIVHGAREAGLPTDALLARALEGASRRAEPAAIVAEVRRNAGALADARTALGTAAREEELVAGAGARMAGVPPESLARLRAVRPAGALTVSLVVLCDIVARGVPVEAASATVITAARTGASDEALLRLRERIHTRIDHGDAPAGATREVLRQWLRTGNGTAREGGGSDGARDGGPGRRR